MHYVTRHLLPLWPEWGRTHVAIDACDLARLCMHQAKKTVACSTEQLTQLNLRCKEMIAQILLSTEREIGRLQEEICGRLHVIFSVGESVALRR